MINFFNEFSLTALFVTRFGQIFVPFAYRCQAFSEYRLFGNRQMIQEVINLRANNGR
jgi:hypothetical protein